MTETTAPAGTAYFDAWQGGVVDTMIGMPASSAERNTKHYAQMNAGILDKEAREKFTFPAQYMFKDVPDYGEVDDPVALLLAEMDRFNITRGMINVATNVVAQAAASNYPDRFIASFNADPNRGMDCVRELEAAVKELGVRSAQVFPAGLLPQVPINAKLMYPLYAKCVELDIPIFVNAGVPGPRVPMGCQDVAHIDEVCWFFPDLKFVMRHGAEPWTALAYKLMLKWPNLFYSPPRSLRSTTPPTSCTTRTPVGPTRSSTRGTSRWGSASNASSLSCPAYRSAITYGPSSSARTRSASSR